MDQPMSTLSFDMMSLIFGVRDLISPPSQILREAGLKPGFHVLDYGCGPGSFSLAAAEIVGPAGRVYAADLKPLALERVQALAARRGLTQVKTIQTDCATGLEDASVDVVLLYDIYHMFAAPDKILAELHRVLKPKGLLSFSDHHMTEEAILSGVMQTGRFSPVRRGEKTYRFQKK
jgi:ubiquinone/menaquinone biosynthesis C-methylase UbiE